MNDVTDKNTFHPIKTHRKTQTTNSRKNKTFLPSIYINKYIRVAATFWRMSNNGTYYDFPQGLRHKMMISSSSFRPNEIISQRKLNLRNKRNSFSWWSVEIKASHLVVFHLFATTRHIRIISRWQNIFLNKHWKWYEWLTLYTTTLVRSFDLLVHQPKNHHHHTRFEWEGRKVLLR